SITQSAKQRALADLSSREEHVLTNLDPHGLRDLQKSREARGGVVGRLVSLHLLLGHTEPFGEIALRETCGEAPFDQSARQLVERRQLHGTPPAITKRLVVGNLGSQVGELASHSAALRLPDLRMHSAARVRVERR